MQNTTDVRPRDFVRTDRPTGVVDYAPSRRVLIGGIVSSHHSPSSYAVVGVESAWEGDGECVAHRLREQRQSHNHNHQRRHQCNRDDNDDDPLITPGIDNSRPSLSHSSYHHRHRDANANGDGIPPNLPYSSSMSTSSTSLGSPTAAESFPIHADRMQQEEEVVGGERRGRKRNPLDLLCMVSTRIADEMEGGERRGVGREKMIANANADANGTSRMERHRQRHRQYHHHPDRSSAGCGVRIHHHPSIPPPPPPPFHDDECYRERHEDDDDDDMSSVHHRHPRPPHVVSYPNGCRYVGQLTRGGIRHGYGECSYPNGCAYVGFWRYGKRHGMGRMTYPDRNETYEGEWRCDARCGRGLYHRDDGCTDVVVVVRYDDRDVATVGYGVRWNRDRTMAYLMESGMRVRRLGLDEALGVCDAIGIPGVPPPRWTTTGR